MLLRLISVFISMDMLLWLLTPLLLKLKIQLLLEEKLISSWLLINKPKLLSDS